MTVHKYNFLQHSCKINAIFSIFEGKFALVKISTVKAPDTFQSVMLEPLFRPQLTE